MQLIIPLTLVLIMATILPSESIAGKNYQGHTKRTFVGLWQAIESSDGSTQLLSVTCSHKEDCDVRLNDTMFTLSCPEEDHTRQGFAQGRGTISHNRLSVNFTLYCTKTDGTTEEVGSQDNAFVWDRSNRTLTNLNDDGLEFPNVFHKISR